MIRGKKGTKVTLTVLRKGENTERMQFTITRDVIDLAESAAKVGISFDALLQRILNLGLRYHADWQ